VNPQKRSKTIDDCADALGIPKTRRLAFKKVVEEFIEASEASIGRRLRWVADRKQGENPAQFAWRAYADEAAAGALHRGIIFGEDEALYWKLIVWLRSHPMPNGIDIPTKSEWYSRQIEAGKAKQGPTRRLRTEGQLIYETLMARRRRGRQV
jgi:hypothetical protein